MLFTAKTKTKTTVSSILAEFNKKLEELQEHRANMLADAQRYDEQIKEILASKKEAAWEAKKAEEVYAKIFDLIK